MKNYAQDLDKHLWKNRILIVKTDGTKLTSYNNQLDEIKKDKNGFIERRLVVYHVQGDTITHLNFSNNEMHNSSLEFGDNNLLIPTKNFEVLLIGLDGGIKIKQTKPITLEELYQKIDAMPMRRSELRKNE